ncbi:hypothetical protein ACFLQ8_01755 [Candidatus Auribacterota bacterium]
MRKKRTFSDFLAEYADLIVIVILGFIPLLWFRDGCVIAGSDFSGYIDPVLYSSNYFYPWAQPATGGANILMPASIPYYVFFGLFRLFGLGSAVSQKIWLVTIFMMSGLSMRFLMRTIAAKRGNKALILSLTAAVFYMINFYVFNIKTFILNTAPLYALTPLVMAFLYRMIVVQKDSFKYVVLTALTTLLFMGSVTNPPFFAVFLFMQFLFLCFIIPLSKSFFSAIKGVLYVILLIALGFLIHAWWFMPFVRLMLEYQGFGVHQHIYWNPGSWIKDTFALGGCWAWGDYYNPVAFPIYQNIFVRYALYLIPVMAFSSLLLNKKYRYFSCFFAILAFAGIFLSKGKGGALGGIFVYFFENVPGFWMFREPYAKFGWITVMGYAGLIGIFAQGLYDKVKEKYRRDIYLVPALCLIVISCAAWPVFTRNFIDQKEETSTSFSVQVPQYWKDASKYVNDLDGNFRLFEMPENKSSYSQLGWAYGVGGCVLEQCFFKKPCISSSYVTVPIIQYAYYLLRDYSYGKFSGIFKLLNAKYVYQRNDFVWQDVRSMPPVKVKKLLDDIGLAKTVSFGAVDLYDTGIKDELIYLRDSVDCVIGGFRVLPFLSYTEYLDHPALFFWGQQSDTAGADTIRYSKRLIFYEDGTDSWVMRLLPDAAKIRPELKLAWKDHDYKNGWSIRNNFYFGEWVSEDEKKYINGDFFEDNTAVYTTGDKPFDLDLDIKERGDYWIGLKSFVSGKGGDLLLSVDGDEFVYDAKSAEEPHMKWFFARKELSPGRHALAIVNKGDQAIVDSIVCYTQKDLNDAVKKAEGYAREKDIEMFFMFDVGAREYEFRVYQEGVYTIETMSLEKTVSPDEKIMMTVDGIKVDLQAGNEKFLKSRNLQLAKGLHKIKTGSKDGRFITRIFSGEPQNKLSGLPLVYERYGPSRIVIPQCSGMGDKVLVFNESYNEGWKLYLTKKAPSFFKGIFSFLNVFVSRSGHTEIGDHFMANGYGNGFYLPETADGNILLEFDPQNDYDRGLLAAVAAVLICLGYLAYYFKKRGKNA